MAGITKVDINLLKENQDNPRTITDAKFQQLVQSVKDFPQMLEVRPIAFKKASEGNVVLGGNMRLRACIAAGLKEVPAIDLTGFTDAQQREFVIKDNVGYGEWEWDKIIADWPEAEEWGLDIPEWAEVKPEAGEDDYEIPDEIQTDIVLGDLFEIGPHRLVCGSSTEADVVAKVLNGKEPYLMVTDPPYGVSYDPMWRKEHNETKGFAAKTKQTGKVQNDNQADWSEAWSLSPSKVVYVWHSGIHGATVSDSLIKNKFLLRAQIIWNKQFGVFGRGDYHWQHEPCWYAVKEGNKGNWAGDRKQTTVWDIKGFNPNGNDLQKKEAKTGHGTQKPVECMARPIKNHDGDVYDPFLGSGTTMVAAHQLNRKCYGIEIDPKYCQVIVDRMRKLDPTLTITKNGLPLQDERKPQSIAESSK
jgi:DNA modification methylase